MLSDRRLCKSGSLQSAAELVKKSQVLLSDLLILDVVIRIVVEDWRWLIGAGHADPLPSLGVFDPSCFANAQARPLLEQGASDGMLCCNTGPERARDRLRFNPADGSLSRRLRR